MRMRRPTLALVALLLAMAALPIGLARGPVARVSAQDDACADYPSGTLQIMAPAAPGGGWDTTAREVQGVLQGGLVEQSVEVFNVEGAGGTIGLAQLASDNAGDPNTLMMMGLVMIGAIGANASETTLDDVTPIARLIAEYEVIVVPADSEYQSFQDVVNAFKADPAGFVWGGGSTGGTDHILVGLIAQAVGVDPTQINYIGYSGGGEALAAILAGDVEVGVSGIGEWQDQIAAGDLRALAISAGAPSVQGTPSAAPAATPATAPIAPTLQEQGVDVVLANWRGLMAGPNLPDDRRACAVALMEEMHASPAWAAVLAKYGWQDYFLAGDEFGAFLAEEQARIEGILAEIGIT